MIPCLLQLPTSSSRVSTSTWSSISWSYKSSTISRKSSLVMTRTYKRHHLQSRRLNLLFLIITMEHLTWKLSLVSIFQSPTSTTQLLIATRWLEIRKTPSLKVNQSDQANTMLRYLEKGGKWSNSNTIYARILLSVSLSTKHQIRRDSRAHMELVMKGIITTRVTKTSTTLI